MTVRASPGDYLVSSQINYCYTETLILPGLFAISRYLGKASGGFVGGC